MADYINKWNVNGVYYNIQDHDRGLPGGVATLDINGRIPIAQLPETSINYRGTWDASTNTPTLVDGTGTQGDMYFVSTSGTWKGEQWYIGDRVIYNGTVWQRVPSSGVNSVNGKDGEVVLYGTDINMSANEATTIEAKINGLNADNPTASGTAEVVVTDITQTKGQISATRKNLPTVSSPTASGNSLAFIDTVSQTNGKLTATKKNIYNASTTQKGVVQLTSSYSATDESKATNGAALAAMLTTLKVDDPTANGIATEVITNISQTNGKITATKKLLANSSLLIGDLQTKTTSSSRTTITLSESNGVIQPWKINNNYGTTITVSVSVPTGYSAVVLSPDNGFETDVRVSPGSSYIVYMLIKNS